MCCSKALPYEVYISTSSISYLLGIPVKFVYEDHQVKVKVIGAKRVENSYFCNVKLPSAITPVL